MLQQRIRFQPLSMHSFEPLRCRVLSLGAGMKRREFLAKKTVTRTDLCEAVYKNTGLSRSESAAFVGLVLEEITDSLEHGEAVKLSSFGSFVVRNKGPRIGRNPKTGKQVPIAPRRVTVFKPSPLLKKRLARADEVIE